MDYIKIGSTTFILGLGGIAAGLSYRRYKRKEIKEYHDSNEIKEDSDQSSKSESAICNGIPKGNDKRSVEVNAFAGAEEKVENPRPMQPNLSSSSPVDERIQSSTKREENDSNIISITKNEKSHEQSSSTFATEQQITKPVVEVTNCTTDGIGNWHSPPCDHNDGACNTGNQIKVDHGEEEDKAKQESNIHTKPMSAGTCIKTIPKGNKRNPFKTMFDDTNKAELNSSFLPNTFSLEPANVEHRGLQSPREHETENNNRQTETENKQHFSSLTLEKQNTKTLSQESYTTADASDIEVDGSPDSPAFNMERNPCFPKLSHEGSRSTIPIKRSTVRPLQYTSDQGNKINTDNDDNKVSETNPPQASRIHDFRFKEPPLVQKTGLHDAVLIYTEVGRGIAISLINFLKCNLRLEKAVDVILYEESAVDIQSEMDAMDHIFDQSRYAFVIMAEDYNNESEYIVKFKAQHALYQCIKDTEKRNRIIPVWCSCKPSVGVFGQLRGIEYYKRVMKNKDKIPDNFFLKSLEELIEKGRQSIN